MLPPQSGVTVQDALGLITIYPHPDVPASFPLPITHHSQPPSIPPLSFKAPISIVSVKCTRRCAVRIRITLIWSTIIWLKMARTCIGLWPVRSSMTTSRNNTIMSWMAYTDFLSRLRIAAGILLPLNTRTLLLYPGGRDCIGAAGVDTYLTTISKTLFGKVSDSILIWNDLK